jgi:DNA-binding NtrC family response regulator
MRLKLSPTHPVFSPVTTADERAQDLCRLARRYEEAGDYGRAEAALREFWAGVGTEPSLNDLGQAAAAEVIASSLPGGDRMDWREFSLANTVRAVEEAFIRRALNASRGSVSKAALLLGYSHPESLNSKIKKLGLHSERTPPRSRRRGVISRSRRRDGGGSRK